MLHGGIVQFNSYLNKIFSQPTKINLLRFLVKNKPEMTGRELARFCKISHTQVYRILNDFEAQGIVKKSSVGGANLYVLNEKNILVTEVLYSLFQKEKVLLELILKRLLSKVENKLLSVVIYGSVAEKRERPISDVDVFLLIKNKKMENSLKHVLPDIEIKFYEQTGNRLSPVVLSIEEIGEKTKTNKTLISNIFSGKVIMGRPPKEFVYGK